MARIFNTTLTANGTTSSINLQNVRGISDNTYTVSVWGTFGSGTVTITASPDGGTTDIPLLDNAGAALTFTANGIRNFLLNSDPTHPLSVSATLTGSTNPSIQISIFRNN